MGDLAGAIAARTRAIRMAASKATLAEGLYYRWRLHYWMNDYDAALDDLTALVASGFELSEQATANVTVFYPALVLADAGEIDAARERLAGFEPAQPEGERWLTAFARLLGGPHANESDETAEIGAGERRAPADEFFAGLESLAQGDKIAAQARLRAAYVSFDGETNYTYPARVLLLRIQMNPDWPAWVDRP
jgi:hypothetical protein